MLTRVVLLDTAGQPEWLMDLPRLRTGDPLKVKAKFKRQNGGRNEELTVDTVVRVEQSGLDASRVPYRQVLKVVTAQGKPCCWVAVKKPEPVKLTPADSGRTLIGGVPELVDPRPPLFERLPFGSMLMDSRTGEVLVELEDVGQFVAHRGHRDDGLLFITVLTKDWAHVQSDKNTYLAVRQVSQDGWGRAVPCWNIVGVGPNGIPAAVGPEGLLP